MKNIFFTILSMLFAISVNAQLINNGASIIVEDGATLFIEGSLQNNLTGSIDVQGTGIIEVEGDVTNAATATITMSNTAKIVQDVLKENAKSTTIDRADWSAIQAHFDQIDRLQKGGESCSFFFKMLRCSRHFEKPGSSRGVDKSSNDPHA